MNKSLFEISFKKIFKLHMSKQITHSINTNNNESLLTAILDKDYEKIDHLLTIDPNLLYMKDKSNRSLLMLAVESNSTEITEILLNHGASVNDTDDFNNIPLMYISLENDIDILKLLLNKKSDINCTNEKNENILSIICKQTQWMKKDPLEHISILIEKNIDINQIDSLGYTPLTNYVINALCINKECIDLFLINEATISLYEEYNTTIYRDLWRGIIEGDLDKVNNTIISNDITNFLKKSDIPLLTLACCSGTFEIVELLIKYKADVNFKDNNNITPLMMACKSGSNDIVKLLLKFDADVNITDNNNNNAISYASLNYHEKTHTIIKSLYNAQNHISYNHKIPLLVNLYHDKSGAHSLYMYDQYKTELIVYTNQQINDNIFEYDIAIINVDSCRETENSLCLEIIQEIIRDDIEKVLENSFQINEYNRSYLLHIACFSKCQKNILKILIDMKCDVNKKNYLGNTPFMMASISGSKMCANFLIENNCDINMVNNKNNNAFMLACKNGRTHKYIYFLRELYEEDYLCHINDNNMDALSYVCKYPINFNSGEKYEGEMEDIIRSLYTRGFNKEYPIENIMSNLMIACRSKMCDNSYDVIKNLLDLDADVTYTYNNQTALSYLISNTSTYTYSYAINMLIEYGAPLYFDINKQKCTLFSTEYPFYICTFSIIQCITCYRLSEVFLIKQHIYNFILNTYKFSFNEDIHKEVLYWACCVGINKKIIKQMVSQSKCPLSLWKDLLVNACKYFKYFSEDTFLSFFRFLLDNNEKVPDETLYWIIIESCDSDFKLSILELLLKRGNFKNNIYIGDKSILYIAICNLHTTFKTIKLLFDYGAADIKNISVHIDGLVHRDFLVFNEIVKLKEYSKIFELFVEHGANPFSVNEDNMNILMYIIRHSYHWNIKYNEQIEFFSKYITDINHRDSHGETILSYLTTAVNTASNCFYMMRDAFMVVFNFDIDWENNKESFELIKNQNTYGNFYKKYMLIKRGLTLMCNNVPRKNIFKNLPIVRVLLMILKYKFKSRYNDIFKKILIKFLFI